MARKEARIFVEVWEHDRFKALSFGAQWLYWAILSQADLSFCGVLSPAVPWWATMADGATPRLVAKWLQELHDADFIVHDVPAAQVWVSGFIRRDGVLDRANLLVAMSRAYAEVRSFPIRARILAELEAHYDGDVLNGMKEKWDTEGSKSAPILDRIDKRMVQDIVHAIADAMPNATVHPIADAKGVHSA